MVGSGKGLKVTHQDMRLVTPGCSAERSRAVEKRTEEGLGCGSGEGRYFVGGVAAAGAEPPQPELGRPVVDRGVRVGVGVAQSESRVGGGGAGPGARRVRA